MSDKIYDVTIRVRLFASDKQLAKKRAIYESGAMTEECSVPMGTTLDSSIEVKEFDGEMSDLPVLDEKWFDEIEDH